MRAQAEKKKPVSATEMVPKSINVAPLNCKEPSAPTTTDDASHGEHDAPMAHGVHTILPDQLPTASATTALFGVNTRRWAIAASGGSGGGGSGGLGGGGGATEQLVPLQPRRQTHTHEEPLY